MTLATEVLFWTLVIGCAITAAAIVFFQNVRPR